ncbi:MAG: methionyl-tRNA formyltransferase [Anaerolineae bacterium]|nr:methionyl-tRNA formyltransferase [Phycisphaerae bacterium]
MTRLNVIFCGAGEFAIPTMRALVAQHEIVQIFTQPDRPAGRGRKLTPTPVGQFALDNNLPLTRTNDINAEQLPTADVMVVIAFGQKIAEHVINHARLGAINLHGSRLPKYRGAAPIHAAILAGETVAGNSVIRLAQKMDAGAVLGMSSLPVGELETTGELHDRLAEDGATLVPRVIEELASGRAVEIEQDHSQASLAPKIKREATKIDWTRPAVELSRQIRAMHPWPGCHVKLLDGDRELVRATLVRARPVAAASDAKPGIIGDAGLVVTGDGAVEIVELQPENGRVMTLSSFKNGHPWRAGMRVESV